MCNEGLVAHWKLLNHPVTKPKTAKSSRFRSHARAACVQTPPTPPPAPFATARRRPTVTRLSVHRARLTCSSGLGMCRLGPGLRCSGCVRVWAVVVGLTGTLSGRRGPCQADSSGSLGGRGRLVGLVGVTRPLDRGRRQRCTSVALVVCPRRSGRAHLVQHPPCLPWTPWHMPLRTS